MEGGRDREREGGGGGSQQSGRLRQRKRQDEMRRVKNFGPIKPRNQCENVLLVELPRCSQMLVSRESNHGEGFALAFKIGSGDMLAQKFEILKTEIYYAQRCMFIHFCPCFSSPDMKNFSITLLFLFGDAGGVGVRLS